MTRTTLFLLTFILFCYIDSNAKFDKLNQTTEKKTEKMEYIDIDSISINNKIPFKTTIRNLEKNLGKPDKVKIETHECGGYFEADTSIIYFYGQTSFETHSDTAVILEINFIDTRFTIKTTDFILSNKTTLNDIKKYFPISIADSNDKYDSKDNKTYRLVRIQTSKIETNDRWILTFNNGKLIKLEYWIPC